MKKILLLGIKTCLLVAALAQHRNAFKAFNTQKLAKEGPPRYTTARINNLKQRLDSILSLDYDLDTQTWRQEEKYTIEYNDQQLQSVGISSDKFGDSLVPYLREEYFYDNYGRLVHKKEINLGIEAQYGDRIHNYRYDHQGLLVVDSVLFTKDQSRSKTEYSYGPNQNLILQKEYKYDTISKSWELEGTDSYSYNAQNLKDSILTQYKYNHRLETFDYDAKGQNIRASTYLTRENNGWALLDKNEYSYDAYGNLIAEVYTSVDYQTKDSLYRYKTEYDVDLSVSSDNLIWIPDAEDLFNHKLTDIRQYDFKDGQWVLHYKNQLYYSSDAITSGDDVAQSLETLWYDVENDILHLPAQDQGRLQLYDMQGRTVLQQQQQQIATSSISLQNINPGFYTYRWVGEGQAQQGKILK